MGLFRQKKLPAVSVEQRKTAAVRQFEQAWQSALEGGTPPELDRFLEDLPPKEQAGLRTSLEAVDLIYRRREDGPHTRPGSDDHTALFAAPAPPQPSHEPRPLDESATCELTPGRSSAQDPEVTSNFTVGETRSGGHEAGSPDELGFSLSVEAGSEATSCFDADQGDGSGPSRELPDVRVGRRARSQMLPQIVGYELLSVLGRGGMGVVYLARQAGLKRLVALKMILAGQHVGPQELSRFQAEAEAAAQLQHPNIVQIYEIGWQDGLPYFSLEYVEGRSLEEDRDGKPLPPTRAADLVITLSRAMHYAHQRGIVHRDLKPANVLLTSDGVPKIADFGLVKRIEGDSAQTDTGTIMGTPSYMAPEQAWGGRAVGPPADVYALGSILYALLTGRPPFLGATPLETVIQLRDRDPVPPSRLQPKTPADLETICLKCLQKDPTKRYGTADELAEDLRRFRAGEPILARPVGPAERTWRWCRRNPSLALSMAAALLLAVFLMIGGPVAAMWIYQEKQIAEKNERLAVHNSNLARENEQKAIGNAEKWRRAQLEADRNAKLASEQRDVAFRSVNTLVEQVQNELRDVPQTQALKQNLLLIAMEELNRVANSISGLEDKNVIMAKAHRKMGDVMLEIGQAERAREQYERCHALLVAQAAKGNPEKPHVPKLNLGRSFVNLGKAAERLHDTGAAKNYYLQALAARQEALPLCPDKLFAEQEIAESYGHLGRISLALGRPREARGYYLESMKRRAMWVERAPEVKEARRELAGTHSALGSANLDLGDVEQAIVHFQENLMGLESIADTESYTVSTRANIALAHNNLGMARLFAGQVDRAEAQYRKAVEMLDMLSRSDPRNALVRRKLAAALYGLGAVCRQQGKPEADEHFRRCLTLRQELVEIEPGDVRFREDLMLALARCGDVQAATKIASELLTDSTSDPSLLYHAACCYAICFAAAPAESQRAPSGDPEAAPAAVEGLPESYAQQALKLLQRAIEQGYRGAARLQMDPDLEPIRDLPEFQERVAQLEQLLEASSEAAAAND